MRIATTLTLKVHRYGVRIVFLINQNRHTLAVFPPQIKGIGLI